jgi:hypothetical protein
MKRSILWLSLSLITLSVLPVLAQGQEAPLDAEAILDRINAAWQGESFYGRVELQIVLSGQTKSHVLEVWTMGEDFALIRMLEPEEDRNSGYLQLDDELWYYAPRIGAIELPAIALADALFGAGPSLEDLSHGTLSDDYDVTVEESEGEGETEGNARWFLTLIPHADAPVVYGKLEIRVTADFVMEKLVYYDQRGDVLQTATFSDVIEVGERRFPTSIVIEDAFGDRTMQRIEEARFDFEIDPSFFSIATFKSWGDAE